MEVCRGDVSVSLPVVQFLCRREGELQTLQPKPNANPTTVIIPLGPILCTGFSGSNVKVTYRHSDPVVTYYTIIDKTGMTILILCALAINIRVNMYNFCLLYTSPSPRD